MTVLENCWVIGRDPVRLHRDSIILHLLGTPAIKPYARQSHMRDLAPRKHPGTFAT